MQITMHKYVIYGLNVASDIELDCYESDFLSDDVRIMEMQSAGEAESLAAEKCGGSKPAVLYSSYDAGKIYICNDNLIIIFKGLSANAEILTAYLLGCVFSYLLMKRNVFTLHGSTVVYRGWGYVLVGNPGAGKSSLSTGFYMRGGKIISDDVSRIELVSGKAFVYPSFPSQKLMKQAADYFRINLDHCKQLSFENRKYLINDNKMFSNEKAPVNAIIQLCPSECEDVTLVRQPVARSLRILMNNTYSLDFIINSDYQNSFYDYIVKLCGIVPVYTLNRPKSGFTVSEQIESIERLAAAEMEVAYDHC